MKYSVFFLILKARYIYIVIGIRQIQHTSFVCMLTHVSIVVLNISLRLQCLRANMITNKKRFNYHLNISNYDIVINFLKNQTLTYWHCNSAHHSHSQLSIAHHSHVQNQTAHDFFNSLFWFFPNVRIKSFKSRWDDPLLSYVKIFI